MSDNKALVPLDSNVFLAFDRLDDDQIIQEMKGAALSEYVYEFSDGAQTVRGLSKIGTDDASRIMAVKYGEVLREVDCWLEREDEQAAYFKAKVSRFVAKNDGTVIEMDSAIGHKRQEKIIALKKGGTKLNPFWYEQGGQKALRNAKQKLMPETIKQAIIAAYVEQGKVRHVAPVEVAQNGTDEPSQQEHWCAAHNVAFQKRSNDKGTWYSHKCEDGTYCNERTQTAPTAQSEPAKRHQWPTADAEISHLAEESNKQRMASKSPPAQSTTRTPSAKDPERETLMAEWGALWNRSVELRFKPTVHVNPSRTPINEFREALAALRAEVAAVANENPDAGQQSEQFNLMTEIPF
jgi:hypothetical protein